jgi:hypothetical protein
LQAEAFAGPRGAAEEGVAGVMTGIAALSDETVDQFEAGALTAQVGVYVARLAGERDRGQFIEGVAARAAGGTRHWSRGDRFHVSRRTCIGMIRALRLAAFSAT